MNYYAQGGQAHGIKSLAQDLAQYGRGGDTMVAHINPQEAEVLKSMGGSGTINPVTGLPEFGFFKSVTNAVAAPFRAANEVVKAVPIIGPAIDRGLVGVDKAVGKTIPGGWGTVASVAGAAAGLPTWALTGLGALSGSGALRGEGKFNLQGAIMGGATAYGMASLGEAARAADIGAYDASSGLTSAAEKTATTSTGDFTAGLAGQAPQVNPNVVSPELYNAAQSNIDPSALEGMSREAVSTAKVLPTTPNTAPSYLDARMADLSSTGRGIANLSGLAGGEGTAAAARTAFTGSGATLQNTAVPIAVGGMGLMALKEQEDALNQANAAGSVSQAEYNTQMGRINEAKARASTAMEENPYKFAEGGEIKGYFGGGLMQTMMDRIQNNSSLLSKSQNSQPTSEGGFGGFVLRSLANDPSIIDRLAQNNKPDYTALAQKALSENPYKFAMGGEVNPPDDQTGMSSRSPMQNFEQGGVPGYAMGGNISRFLSGGGDGLSDSIPATIGDKQPAKLADGEFVVSSDVVSGLGGGSSKAGAKKLYAMMDRVRKQAHGTKKQIRPVSTKALPA